MLNVSWNFQIICNKKREDSSRHPFANTSSSFQHESIGVRVVGFVRMSENDGDELAPAAASTYQFFIILRGNNNETLPLIFISDFDIWSSQHKKWKA